MVFSLVTSKIRQSMCSKSANHIKRTFNYDLKFIFFLISEGQIHFMEMKFPIESEESIVDLYREFLQSHPKVRLAVVGRS